jgi:hypothetical protein
LINRIRIENSTLKDALNQSLVVAAQIAMIIIMIMADPPIAFQTTDQEMSDLSGSSDGLRMIYPEPAHTGHGVWMLTNLESFASGSNPEPEQAGHK